LHEWFTHEDHIDVMKNVDSKILECLHNTESDFFRNAWIDQKEITKYNYDTNRTSYWTNFIDSIKTWSLEKYKDIEWIEDKIIDFLKQDILYAYSINFSSNR
jgi:hypothetical protein